MIMNEYRLNTMDPEVDPFILQQMEDFFFGEGAAPATGYAAPGQRLIRAPGTGFIRVVLISTYEMGRASLLGSLSLAASAAGRPVPLWCVRIRRAAVWTGRPLWSLMRSHHVPMHARREGIASMWCSTSKR